MSLINEITSIIEWQKHVASLPEKSLLIVSFYAPWAAPCTQMSAILSTLAAEYPVTDHPTTSWVSINAEDLNEISEQFDVTAVPFLVLLRNGQVVETVSGSSAVKVRDAIESQMKNDSGGVAVAAANALKASSGALHREITTDVPRLPSPKSSGDLPSHKEDMFRRLSSLVRAAPVMLFMKGTPSSPQCGFSRQIVSLLRDHAVKYGFFNILADEEVRKGLKEYADWPTYPQLWIDGELVGGLDIVKEEIANNPTFLSPYSVKS